MLHKGIIIVRFEMPFHVWCLHCKEHIGAGVRFNAAKKKSGMYLSTPIYEFKMKCHLCSGEIVIQTDPQNADYICVSGVRRKIEEWQPSAEDQMIVMKTDEERKRLAEDVMYGVEHQAEDERKLEEAGPRMEQLLALNSRDWQDNYARSQQLRKRFRDEKKVATASVRQGLALQDRFALSIPLLPPSEGDVVMAQGTEFSGTYVFGYHEHG